MDDCYSLLEPLVGTFKREIRIDDYQGDCRVIFPFSRVDGDPVILYVISKADNYVITDAGETHGMLLTSGVDFDTEKREHRITAAKTRFNLDAVETEIRLTATENDLGRRLLDAYEAVQWISFLVYTRRPYSPSYFKDKVASFLRSSGYDFLEEPDVTAESEPETVDFEIVGLQHPTYLESIQARNITDLHEKCRNTSYKWIKIDRAQPNSRFITVLDDIEGVFKKEKMAALFDDSDAVIPWSEQDDLVTALSQDEP